MQQSSKQSLQTASLYNPRPGGHDLYGIMPTVPMIVTTNKASHMLLPIATLKQFFYLFSPSLSLSYFTTSLFYSLLCLIYLILRILHQISNISKHISIATREPKAIVYSYKGVNELKLQSILSTSLLQPCMINIGTTQNISSVMYPIHKIFLKSTTFMSLQLPSTSIIGQPA